MQRNLIRKIWNKIGLLNPYRRLNQQATELARLSAIVAEHQKWNEFRPLIDALLNLEPDERQWILSGDLGIYDVGKKNAPTRDHWIAEKLKELPAGARLLDAGAGECQYKKYCEHLNYVAQDVAVYDASDAAGLQNEGWDFSQIDIVSDICSIPEQDHSFDVVLCTEVFEHLPDPVRALEELVRLLRPGGILITTAPFWSLTHQAPFHFATGFNRYFYEHHYDRLGLEIIDMVPNGNFFECLAQEVRRVPSMAQRFTRSKPTSLDLIGMQIVMRMVKNMSHDDKGSDEMLHFDYQVCARKK